MNTTTITNDKVSIKENRLFRMHPDLLFSVIQSQAGSLNKALLELVMNSVDASATRVDITLDRKRFSVRDDGKGFTAREQIELFFETFGQPHKEGDAPFGKFRIGRGQSFSFAENKWRSGPFAMQVDIKGKGLDYTLESGLENHAGCLIEGKLYDPLDPSELRRIELDLTDQCTYTPIPVFLNGKSISKDADKQKWTAITDDAYLLINTSRHLSVYNLGVLVANFPAYDFGVGGVIVSKKQLRLNFARNDILRAQCDVWKGIRNDIKKQIPKDESAEKPTKRNESWRQYQAQQVMCMSSPSLEEFQEALAYPLFTDIKGKNVSAAHLAVSAGHMPIVVAPGKSLLADRLHDTKMAYVLTNETFTNRFRTDIEGVFIHLAGLTVDIKPGAYTSYLMEYPKKILAAHKPFDAVTSLLESSHHIMSDDELTPDVKCAVRAIEETQGSIAYALSKHLGSERVNTRAIRVMRSDSAEAFTDGAKHIFINMKHLRGAAGPNQGISWCHFMCSLILHELCHDFDSGTGHTHDEDFYHAYHEASFEGSFSIAVERLFRSWVALSNKLPKNRPNKTILSQMDADANLEDRREAVAAA